MPAYEAVDFDPPAPVARATVVANTLAEDVPVLLDSGAEVSGIPRWAAVQCGVRLDPNRVALEAFDGTTAWSDVAQLQVEVGPFTFRGAFVIVDSEHGILGRNILNALVLELDGPRLHWSAASS